MPKKRGTKAVKLTKAQLLKREKAIIADIRGSVLSYRQIAKKHKVSLPTVNNKARKAGISRGRRKGAKILVAAPKRTKAARKAVRKAPRRKAMRKAARRKARKAVPMVTDLPVMRKTRKRARRVRRVRAVRAIRAGGRKSAFVEAMRELVLRYRPNISLKAYDRLVRTVQAIA